MNTNYIREILAELDSLKEMEKLVTIWLDLPAQTVRDQLDAIAYQKKNAIRELKQAIDV